MPNQNAAFYDAMARYYDAENADLVEDLLLYGELAQEYEGPVLEIGCGTGRVLLHLAREGAHVVGVDHSAAMLARARRKLDRAGELSGRAELIEGDALEVAPPGPFRLILVPYNTFAHFGTQAAQVAALRHFRRRAAPDALLVLDLPHAGELFATPDAPSLALDRVFTEPESGHLVMQQSLSTLARAEQKLHVIWIYDEIMDDGAVRRTLAPLDLRLILPGEMDLMLQLTGWRRAAWYGDYDQSPFEEGSPRMIVLAEPDPESGA